MRVAGQFSTGGLTNGVDISLPRCLVTIRFSDVNMLTTLLWIQSLPSISGVTKFFAMSAVILDLHPLMLISNVVSPMISTAEQFADK